MAIILLGLLVPLILVSGSAAQAINVYEAIAQLNQSIATLQQRYHFMATLSKDGLIEKGVIKFDKVLTNELGVYNSANGEFIAPRPGLYLFMAQIVVLGIGGGSMELYCNEKIVSVWNIDPFRDSNNELSYPLLLKSGDKVYVKSRGRYNLYGQNHSFFSGYLAK